MLYITWYTWSTKALTCRLFTVMQTYIILKYFSKGFDHSLNWYPFLNATLCGGGYPFVVKWIACPGKWLINEFVIPAPYLKNFKRHNFNDSKLTCIRIDHCHSDNTNIIIYGSTTWMMFYYILSKLTYQIYIHHIPQFSFLYYWVSDINK